MRIVSHLATHLATLFRVIYIWLRWLDVDGTSFLRKAKGKENRFFFLYWGDPMPAIRFACRAPARRKGARFLFSLRCLFISLFVTLWLRVNMACGGPFPARHVPHPRGYAGTRYMCLAISGKWGNEERLWWNGCKDAQSKLKHVELPWLRDLCITIRKK